MTTGMMKMITVELPIDITRLYPLYSSPQLILMAHSDEKRRGSHTLSMYPQVKGQLLDRYKLLFTGIDKKSSQATRACVAPCIKPNLRVDIPVTV
jgi:hypothetical protein